MSDTGEPKDETMQICRALPCFGNNPDVKNSPESHEDGDHNSGQSVLGCIADRNRPTEAFMRLTRNRGRKRDNASESALQPI